MNKVVAMANRYRALLRLSGCPTVDPSIKYEDEIERRIEAIHLPKQKWGRHFRAIGLTNLPRGHSGPKRARRAARRPGKLVKINFALPTALAHEVRARAQEEHLSVSAYLRGLTHRDLQRMGLLTPESGQFVDKTGVK
jgi:hypothetical protein